MKSYSKVLTVSSLLFLVLLLFGLSIGLSQDQGRVDPASAPPKAPAAESETPEGAPPEKSQEGGPPERPPASVVTAKVKEGAYSRPLRLTGNIEPFERTDIAAEQQGIAAQIHADEGDKVSSGTVLMELRELPLQLEYQRAKANADEEEQTLRELERGTRDEDIAIAKANWEEARAKARISRDELERREELLKDGTISQSEYDIYRSEWETAQATEQVMKARYERALNGPRQEEIAAQRARVSSTAAEAELALDALERSKVKAPYDGVIVQRYCSPGSYVRPGDPLFTMEHQDTVKVTVQVPETHLRRIELGQEKKFFFDAFPRDQFAGVAAQIIPRADMRSRSFPVKFHIDNSEGLLASGMLGRMVLDVSNEGERSTVIAKDALVPQLGKIIVYRVDFRDGKPFAEAVDVNTGRFFGEAVEVFGSLEEGQQVVVRGNERLQPGQPLRLNQFVTNPQLADTIDESRFFEEEFDNPIQTRD